jgi:hypothetical protein
MANMGRILRIDEKLLSEKSPSEIEVMVKLMMVKHFNNATGNYKKNELKSYVFHDSSGNATRFSLEELGLAGAKNK